MLQSFEERKEGLMRAKDFHNTIEKEELEKAQSKEESDSGGKKKCGGIGRLTRELGQKLAENTNRAANLSYQLEKSLGKDIAIIVGDYGKAQDGAPGAGVVVCLREKGASAARPGGTKRESGTGARRVPNKIRRPRRQRQRPTPFHHFSRVFVH
jgi:hypothetical protein